jgi:hypothetical protein
MNEKDKQRFARYLPGFKDPLDEETHPSNANTIGYIEKITIDKNKLITDVIKNVTPTSATPTHSEKPVKKASKKISKPD